jgi:hypothetical protein
LTYNDIAKNLFTGKDLWNLEEGDVDKLDWSLTDILYADNSKTREQLESILALNKLCNVAKYLNGDWIPNFMDSSRKWYIYISEGGALNIHNFISTKFSIVYFKTEQLAQQAIEILGEEEIRKALTLNW